ncbi:MAG: pyridoxamine 5'-phosphate oxidase family protein [Candidatus Rokubacteria bacterium]|nr:pyridoxamine 5'-phosphate oxidase family protein [Candidatus Rokubacteria bacterium]
MNIQVAREQLAAAVRERGSGAYVLTVTEDGTPHVVHARVEWDGAELVAEVGARTAENASARPRISLLYPIRSETDYSLIVDGVACVEAAGDGRRLRVTPARGVFHRPGPSPDPASSCTDDCIPIFTSLDAARSAP